MSKIKKIKYQTVIDKFIKYNCELQMDEKTFNLLDPNEKTVFKYKTSCGHEREMSYKSFMNGNGAQCISCTKSGFADKHRDKRGLSFEFVKKLFEDNKCKLLAETDQDFRKMFKNNSSTVKYIASCGHENQIKYISFSNGLGLQCKSCTQAINGKKSAEKQRKPFEEVEKFFSDNGCKLIYDKTQFESIYKNCESKLKYISKCGHEYETTYSIFKSGKARNCKECTLKLMGEKSSKLQNNKSQTNYEDDIINAGKTKLNLKTVIKKFTDNNCKLLIDSNEVFYSVYKNSSSVLPYVAQCGHENSICYKTFCAGSGLLCNACTKVITGQKIGQKQKLDYQTVKSKFDNKKCKLLITEDEFDSQYKNFRSKLKYIATCGHENETPFGNFSTNESYGLLCSVCTNNKVSNLLKENYSGDNRLCLIKMEFNSINYLMDLLKLEFDCVKASDGCKSDIIIKQKNTLNNYVGIQVKSTGKKNCKDKYCFNIGNKDYTGIIIICVCESDKKIWCFTYDDIKSAGAILTISQVSKYNKFECVENELSKIVSELYGKLNKNTFDNLNKPINVKTQQELEYKTKRVEKIPWINFIQSPMEGTVYDFKIVNYKFQEKVGTLDDNGLTNIFYLSKKCGANKKQCYEISDNDFYWLNCKNSDEFYVIPEKELVDRDIVGKPDKKPVKLRINPNKTTWVSKYKFDYNNIYKSQLNNLIHGNLQTEKHFDI